LSLKWTSTTYIESWNKKKFNLFFNSCTIQVRHSGFLSLLNRLSILIREHVHKLKKSLGMERVNISKYHSAELIHGWFVGSKICHVDFLWLPGARESFNLIASNCIFFTNNLEIIINENLAHIECLAFRKAFGKSSQCVIIAPCSRKLQWILAEIAEIAPC
jgi:hypothetical protein